MFIVRYIYNWMLAIDIVGNVFLLGSPFETISQRLGRHFVTGRMRWPFVYIMIGVDLWFLVFTGERNHCINAHVNRSATERELYGLSKN